MMRVFRVAVTVVAVSAGVASLALAHPPYEGRAIVLKGTDGSVEVVKSYVDGIFFTDPVKIIVRSPGHGHAETPYYRDASMACVTGRCLVAASDSALLIVPQHVWLVDGTSLRPMDSLSIRLLGIAVHLWDHSVGYAFAVLCGVLPVLGVRRLDNGPAPTTLLAGCLSACVVLGTFGLIVVWLYVVALLSELSLFWAAIIVALVFCGGRYMKHLLGSAQDGPRRLHG